MSDPIALLKTMRPISPRTFLTSRSESTREGVGDIEVESSGPPVRLALGN
jgi:hypothetical protein